MSFYITFRYEHLYELLFGREKPLHLNVFSKSQAIIDEFVSRTSSGGLSANDCLLFKIGELVLLVDIYHCQEIVFYSIDNLA